MVRSGRSRTRKAFVVLRDGTEIKFRFNRDVAKINRYLANRQPDKLSLTYHDPTTAWLLSFSWLIGIVMSMVYGFSCGLYQTIRLERSRRILEIQQHQNVWGRFCQRVFGQLVWIGQSIQAVPLCVAWARVEAIRTDGDSWWQAFWNQRRNGKKLHTLKLYFGDHQRPIKIYQTTNYQQLMSVAERLESFMRSPH
ncbi:hypothetical protein IQ266_01520 [filamentous cyanobacterium LEGE 11480]|uniref:Uncharacterized protein n=1 Tax=Romeriopsis navalis LEGE 11480 TaxID=2777977 RepID=A0A928VIL4_9CYAN|nr:hypothetical protein [Romeriopsis navalis]MBE9028433.1 hypothetical protein [Romeriopsis navalis LEGE 11480]